MKRHILIRLGIPIVFFFIILIISFIFEQSIERQYIFLILKTIFSTIYCGTLIIECIFLAFEKDFKKILVNISLLLFFLIIVKLEFPS